MSVHNCLYLLVLALAVFAAETSLRAAGDSGAKVPASNVTDPQQKSSATDSSAVIHKSVHKQKNADGTPTSSTPLNASVTVGPAATSTTSVQPSNAAKLDKPPVTIIVSDSVNTVVNTVHSTPISGTPSSTSQNLSNGTRPTVETALPVARYPGTNIPIKGVSTYIPPAPAPPTTTPVPTGQFIPGKSVQKPFYSSTFSPPLVPLTSSAASSYAKPAVSKPTTSTSNFVFTNFTKKSRNTYPWKTGIFTTMFWIGEGGSSISPTTNIGSAWDENWRSSNRGSDNPYDRNGYSPADHAPTVNPFYVALPFNDLAFPDKARQWLPAGWYRRPKDGKQVSACKDRWVEIKNAQGRTCYAQWEDVGPLRYDHAEYVFGSERPDTYTRAGLDVSPAVAQYLGIGDSKRALTSWRFVDDEDVPPGAWLKYDEQAVIYTALHQLKTAKSTATPTIQRSAEPIEDASSIDTNKKKVDASKG